MVMQRFVLIVFFKVVAVLCPGVAASQDFPYRPIRIITVQAGGVGDLIARPLAQGLAAPLGQPVIVENRPSGFIPGDMVAKASPDGYTLLVTSAILWIGPLMQKSPYDPVKDFAPITLLATTPNVLVVHPSLPVKNVADLVKLAKARPGQLTYASAGSGSTTHLSAELFKTMGGLNMIHIPYKGGSQALTDLLGGQISMYFSSLPGAMPHIKNSRLRPLSVTSARRSTAAPELSTMAESGFAGYDADTWIGAVTPAGTPQAVIVRLHDEIIRILNVADIRERLLMQGAEPLTNTPEQFAAYIKSEIVKWAKVVKASGARAE